MPETTSTDNRVTVTLTHDFARLNTLQEEWAILQQESAANTLFLTWDWITVWWKNFGTQGKLWLLEARNSAGQLVGLAPLIQVSYSPVRGVSWRQIEFIGTSTYSDHLDFIVKHGMETTVVPAFIQALKDKQSRWDVLKLSSVPESSPNVAILRATGIPWEEDIDNMCPFVPLPADWDTHYMSLSHNKRKQQRRAQRDLDNAFPDQWTWNRVENAGELEDALNEMIRLHQAKWLALGLGGGFGDTTVVNFHHAVAQQMLGKGHLGLYRLQIDGRTVATEYTYFYGGNVYSFASGVDFEFADYSPGHILTEMIMHKVIDAGGRGYDFLRGEEDYKARWGAQNQADLGLRWVASLQGRFKNRAVEFARIQWAKVKRRWRQQSVS